MSDGVVADTMAVVLRLERRRMPPKVRALFEAAEQGFSRVYIPAMAMAEIGYLSERQRIKTSLRELAAYCGMFPAVEIAPTTQDVILRSFEINDIPELHDRIIAGTAYAMGLSLITNDPVITQSSFVTGIW